MPKNKVYTIWWKIPFGFCAEIDEDSSNQIKALQDVLVVLLDYSFDAKSQSKGGEGRSSGLDLIKFEAVQLHLLFLIEANIFRPQITRPATVLPSVAKKQTSFVLGVV
ncbi:hypothetical protein IFM89_017602 [Coptis chinensis]|uniref:MORF/ORRM1/DAG-like MORF domain-containing protein n=1 Tax=Coptis chinensis TaxID=261450 RepID=A0A835LB62_9MAGN|nr:hypothetical protein IFM89_017602 [Coptis chinensis]